MAEFQVVVKELERMCNTYHAVRGICGTDECPLYCEDLCYAQAMIHVHGDDACNLEKVVMSWAAEHPEPVYPTWGEWLESIEVIKYNDRVDSINYLIRPTPKTNTQIPADLAQKLGLQPKEE